MFYRQKSRAFLAPHCILGLGSTYGDAVPRLHAKEDTAQALMPCAMSSLRGASGVVGCDRVVCPLVLHATTIAHLDVRLCTDLFFLLCAVLLCGAVCSVCAAPVPLSCGVPCALPSLPVVWLRGAVAVVCGCVLTLLSLPLWVCATVCPVLPVSCLPYFLGIIPALYMGGAICGPCTLPIYVPLFLGLLFMIRSVHTVKAGPWIPNADFQKSA